MKDKVVRRTSGGAEILILGKGRISVITVDYDRRAVGFENRGLDQAVISVETTGLAREGAIGERQWEFKFPDGQAVVIQATGKQRAPSFVEICNHGIDLRSKLACHNGGPFRRLSRSYARGCSRRELLPLAPFSRRLPSYHRPGWLVVRKLPQTPVRGVRWACK